MRYTSLNELISMILQSSEEHPFTLDVTPEIAKYLLDNFNKNNRRLEIAKVKKYANMMTRGEWHLNNQGIGISKNGTLIDGQHRLHAVVMCGLTVKMLFCAGLKEEARQTVDRCRPRTLGDDLCILGYKHYGTISKSIGYVLCYTYSAHPNTIDPMYTNNEKLQLVSCFKDDLTKCAEIADSINSEKECIHILSAGVICAFLFCTQRLDSNMSTRFIYELCSKNTSNRCNLIREARDWVCGAKMAKSFGRYDSLCFPSLLWKDYVNGKDKFRKYTTLQEVRKVRNEFVFNKHYSATPIPLCLQERNSDIKDAIDSIHNMTR